MTIHTVYSDTHVRLHRVFENSLRAVEPDAVLISHRLEQDGNGEFRNKGWHSMMTAKVRAILAACETNEPFMFADCDILWLRPFAAIADILLGRDVSVMFQQHGNETKLWPCTGLFLVRNCAEAKRMWLGVMDTIHSFPDEETALARWLKLNPFDRAFLPHCFWTPGILRKAWKPGDELPLPPDAVCLHASWTVGIESKLAMMREAARQTDAPFDSYV